MNLSPLPKAHAHTCTHMHTHLVRDAAGHGGGACGRNEGEKGGVHEDREVGGLQYMYVCMKEVSTSRCMCVYMCISMLCRTVVGQRQLYL